MSTATTNVCRPRRVLRVTRARTPSKLARNLVTRCPRRTTRRQWATRLLVQTLVTPGRSLRSLRSCRPLRTGSAGSAGRTSRAGRAVAHIERLVTQGDQDPAGGAVGACGFDDDVDAQPVAHVEGPVGPVGFGDLDAALGAVDAWRFVDDGDAGAVTAGLAVANVDGFPAAVPALDAAVPAPDDDLDAAGRGSCRPGVRQRR